MHASEWRRWQSASPARLKTIDGWGLDELFRESTRPPCFYLSCPARWRGNHDGLKCSWFDLLFGQIGCTNGKDLPNLCKPRIMHRRASSREPSPLISAMEQMMMNECHSATIRCRVYYLCILRHDRHLVAHLVEMIHYERSWVTRVVSVFASGARIRVHAARSYEKRSVEQTFEFGNACALWWAMTAKTQCIAWRGLHDRIGDFMTGKVNSVKILPSEQFASRWAGRRAASFWDQDMRWCAETIANRALTERLYFQQISHELPRLVLQVVARARQWLVLGVVCHGFLELSLQCHKPGPSLPPPRPPPRPRLRLRLWAVESFTTCLCTWHPGAKAQCCKKCTFAPMLTHFWSWVWRAIATSRGLNCWSQGAYKLLQFLVEERKW